MPNKTLSDKNINGPINIVRLEGKINDITKVLYVFFDKHLDVGDQTKCDTIFSSDVSKYFSTEFNKLDSDKKYDFFVEIHSASTDINNEFKNDIQYRQKYILEIRKLFRKLFNFDYEENKILQSNIFDNIRLHYIDPRDYFKFYFMDGMYNIYYLSTLDYQIIEHQIYLDHIIEDTTNMEEIFNYHVELIDAFLKGTSTKVTKVPIAKKDTIQYHKKVHPEYPDEILYLLDKIINRYNDVNIKKKLNDMAKLLSEELNTLAKTCKKINTQAKELKFKLFESDDNEINYDRVGDTYTTKYPSTLAYKDILEIQIGLRNVALHIELIFAKYVDIFFLRRFLDKEYITNGISYTGAHHSSQYIYTLVKYFDFQVTHVAYPETTNLQELNEKIKEADSVYHVSLMFFDLRMGTYQCSNVDHFPTNFS